ncbi:MAG TPA: tetratricopeptide repeat protein [Chloroflexia bacterium]|nr:tetratricopeptide repeat protein [Chloroflexia bacterium]
MNDGTAFGAWLKQRRRAQDLTQSDLASQVGCSVKTVEKIEAGALRPSKQLAELLAECLAIPSAERPGFVQWARAARPEGPLGRPGAAGDAPAAARARGLSRVPAPPTLLIGREREVARVHALLARPDVRLVTCTGPPGIGKSRLALQVANDLLATFPEGVVFVALGPITDPALVASTIAGTLEVREAPGRPLGARLKDYLREKAMLLVLDNFEQVMDAASLVADLLAEAPRLKLLVTSRAILHLRGEREVAVPPLALPPPLPLPPLDALAQIPAIALFLQSALDAQPEFELTTENAPAIAAICHRLEGLPLAIELAAARIKILAPATLLARLESRLQILTGGARDLPARQQTLRNAIAWSYDLLDPAEQTLLRRLGVFVGGATLPAANAVGGRQYAVGSDDAVGGGRQYAVGSDEPVGSRQSAVGSDDVGAGGGDPGSESTQSKIQNPKSKIAQDFILDGLTALVDKSLLQQTAVGGEPRFTMLEMIREYALERLAERGEVAAVRDAHLAYFRGLAHQAQPALWGAPAQVPWLNRLEIEHGNLRAALDWALEHAAPAGLQLAGALGLFWQIHGHWSEGRERLATALARAPAPDAARAGALYMAGGLALNQSDLAAAQALFEASRAIYESLDYPRGLGNALIGLGQVAGGQGDFATARGLFERSLQLKQATGDRLGWASALRYLGDLALMEGDPERTRTLYEESLALYRAQGDTRGVAILLTQLGHILLSQGFYSAARAHFEESLLLQRELGNRAALARTLNALVELLLLLGDYAPTPALLEESLAIARELGSKADLADQLHLMGQAAIYQTDYPRATLLLEESLRLADAIGNKGIRSWVLNLLGQIALYQGDSARARSWLEESLGLYRELGLRGGISIVLGNLGAEAGYRGDYARARALWVESLGLYQELGSALGLIYVLERFASLAIGQGQAIAAARLWGAAAAQREALGAPQPPAERALWAPHQAAAQAALAPETWAAAWAAGRALALDEAIAYALAAVPEP